jgi:hypothetical protein
VEILNHAEAAQVTLQSALSVVLQPFLRAQSVRGVLQHLVLSAGFASAVAGTAWGTEPPAAVVSDAPLGQAASSSTEAEPVFPAQDVGPAVDSESARAAWRTFMAHNPMPVGGCFHASYPSIVWERVDCKMNPPRVHPTHVRPKGDEAQVTGNGPD